MRAGRSGIAAICTRTGAGTQVAEGGLPWKYDEHSNVAKASPVKPLQVFETPQGEQEFWTRTFCAPTTSKDFSHEAVDVVGIELFTADELVARLATAHPSKMLAAHRLAVTGAADASTLAELRRANAAKVADLMAQMLDL